MSRRSIALLARPRFAHQLEIEVRTTLVAAVVACGKSTLAGAAGGEEGGAFTVMSGLLRFRGGVTKGSGHISLSDKARKQRPVPTSCAYNIGGVKRASGMSPRDRENNKHVARL